MREVWEGAAESDTENYRKDISHWRGVGRWQDDAAWQRIGQKTRAMIASYIRYCDLPKWGENPVFLEWGQGGGANLFALKDVASQYIGVDVSQSNLIECERMIAAEGYDSFTPVLIKESPDEVLTHELPKLSYFLSTAVFQHFPSQEYGAAVLKVLSQLCQENAIGLIQIRYDNGDYRFQGISDISEYAEKHITANSYPIDEFYGLCQDSGFEVLGVFDINTKVNYAYFGLRKK